jgi:hypothetical protein
MIDFKLYCTTCMWLEMNFMRAYTTYVCEVEGNEHIFFFKIHKYTIALGLFYELHAVMTL